MALRFGARSKSSVVRRRSNPPRISHLFLATLLGFLTATGVSANAPEGVPRELARERAAEISELQYRLSFVLVPNAPVTSGIEEIQFKLRTVRTVLLDFRDGTVQGVVLNGSTIPANVENGH